MLIIILIIIIIIIMNMYAIYPPYLGAQNAVQCKKKLTNKQT